MMMTEQMLDKLLDDAIDAQFMKRGFKASAMREAVLKTLKDNNLHIAQGVSAKWPWEVPQAPTYISDHTKEVQDET